MSSRISKRVKRKKRMEHKKHKSILLPLPKVLKFYLLIFISIFVLYKTVTSFTGDIFTNKATFIESKATPKTDSSLVEIKKNPKKATRKDLINTNKPLSNSKRADLLSLTYQDKPFTKVNNSIPAFTKEEIEKAKTNENKMTKYEMDNLNRPLKATKVISKSTLTNRKRDDISSIYPPGFHNKKYKNNLYVYNRCHLIAHVLGGIDKKENLVTGTRYLNIEGMWQIEETLKYAVSENKDTKILYRVTPIYKGNELVCRGVLMDAYSLNDNGKTISLSYYCFNVQPGINIDYRTGRTCYKMK